MILRVGLERVSVIARLADDRDHDHDLVMLEVYGGTGAATQNS